jgi:hypothetical protein
MIMTHSVHVTSYLSVTDQTALAAPRLQRPMSGFGTGLEDVTGRFVVISMRIVLMNPA